MASRNQGQFQGAVILPMLRALLLAAAAAALSACQSLPASGPTGRAIAAGAGLDQGAETYAMVSLDFATTERLRATPPRLLGGLAGSGSVAPIDIIGVGDVVAVSVYEPGGALFGSRGPMGASSGRETFPAQPVDREGRIAVPYAGRVRIAGLNTAEAADAIRRALTGMVANPQVVVNLNQSLSNSVTVLGDAGSPGRYPLSPNTADLLGVLAISGGPRFPIDDTQLTLTRQGRSLTVPLAAVTRLPDENIRLQPGDQLLLQHRPRRISTFGALGAVTQRDMGPGELTLTEALASVGGLNPTAADARMVLIFRFERPEVADMLGIAQAPTPRGVPVVYRLNLAEPEGFFIANNFVMQPDDVIYAPTTTTAELRKFFEFVQTITRVVYDVQVASTLNVN